MQCLEGKKGLIMGVLNDHSIAWGIAKAVREAGAEIALTYQGEPAFKRVEPLSKTLGCKILLPCDVTNEEEVNNVFTTLDKEWGHLDFIVHAIAYSRKEELTGRFINTTQDNFLLTMNISVYSLTAIAKAGHELLAKSHGSILAMSYYGAEKVVPNYNVMGVAKAALEASVRYLSVDLGRDGIRVNAISSGPIKTLAAAGISDFRYLLRWHEENAPLKRNVTIEDNGNAAVYLLSDFAANVTGEILHVDSGYNVIGMKDVDNKDKED